MNLSPAETTALSELRDWLAGHFGERLRRLALFGSRARGEGHEESDLDVLIVVEGLSGAEAREVGYQSGDLLTRHDVLVSPLCLSSARYDLLRQRERRLIREIERDAVAL